MRIIYSYLIQTLWLLWWAYWRVSAGNVKPAVRIESVASRVAHVLPLLITAVLLLLPASNGWLFQRFIPRARTPFWIGAAVIAAGLAFSIWARAVLGRNWSATVTVKAEHELIQAGPYRRIRHPIYTGLLLGFIGTEIARGTWAGLLGVLIAFIALWRKLRLEERYMLETFGDSYRSYRARSGALIPWLL